MRNRHIYSRRYKAPERLYRGQWCLNTLQSRHLGTSHSSPNCYPLLHCIFQNIILSLSKVVLVFGKSKIHRAPNLGCRGLSHRGDLLSHGKTARDVMQEWTCCRDEAASHQVPRAAAFWIIWIVSMEECSSLTQNLMRIHCSTCPVILYTMATQYACSLSVIYHPHRLVQWSHHCSHMCIPVYSTGLLGYINVA